MATEIKKIITNEEYGIEVYVAKITTGFSVAMKDTDADEFVGFIKVYPDYERALAYAKEIAA